MTSSPKTKQVIYQQQRKRAADRGIMTDINGYTQTLDQNLFQPLSKVVQADYAAGRGNELRNGTETGKMQALHSSSALVCNTFDYWCSQLQLGTSLAALTSALGAPAAVNQLQFEQAYPTGLGGTPPHLDVVLLGDESKPFLIESKFTEPYLRKTTKDAFKKSYFPTSGELWGKYGLTRCEDLARRISANQENFFYLSAPQLLKHILGIANAFNNDFTLLYLWYDYPSTEAAEHRVEIETFMHRLNGEIDFRAMTYKALFKKMQSASTVDKKYIAYLTDRY